MIILTENNSEFSITSSDLSIPPYHWCFDGKMLDFGLRKIEMLEEATGQMVTVQLENSIFTIPASWYILAVEEETKYIDMVEIMQCAARGLKAFLMSPQGVHLEMCDVRLLNMQEGTEIYPSMPKHTAMCHPIGSRTGLVDLACVIGPTDLHKYISRRTARELLL